MDCSLIASDGGENWAINFYANRHPRNEQQRKSERPKLLFSFSQCACSWCVNLIEFKLSFRLNLCCLFSSLSCLFFHLTTTRDMNVHKGPTHKKFISLCWHYFHAQFMPSCCSYFGIYDDNFLINNSNCAFFLWFQLCSWYIITAILFTEHSFYLKTKLFHSWTSQKLSVNLRTELKV